MSTKPRKTPPPRWYRYFYVVVGLAWLKDSESYAGSSVPPGRVSHDGKVEGDDPDEKRHPCPGWGLNQALLQAVQGQNGL